MGGFMDHKDRRVLRVNWRVIASVRMCVMTADSPVLGVLYIYQLPELWSISNGH